MHGPLVNFWLELRVHTDPSVEDALVGPVFASEQVLYKMKRHKVKKVTDR